MHQTYGADGIHGKAVINGHYSGSRFHPGNDAKFKELLRNMQHSNQNLHTESSGLKKVEASGRSNLQIQTQKQVELLRRQDSERSEYTDQHDVLGLQGLQTLNVSKIKLIKPEPNKNEEKKTQYEAFLRQTVQ